jgi:hypothetical protein
LGRVVGGDAQDPRQHRGDGALVEGAEQELLRQAVPRELATQAVEARPDGDLVGPVGDEDQDRVVERRAGEVVDQAMAGGVGPVEVLQNQDEAPVRRPPADVARGGLEQAAALEVGLVPARAELGEHPGRERRRQRVGQARLGRTRAALGPQGVAEDAERQRRVEGMGPPLQHQTPTLARPGGDLGRDARLAEARLGHDLSHGAPVGGGLEQRPEPLQDRLPPEDGG